MAVPRCPAAPLTKAVLPDSEKRLEKGVESGGMLVSVGVQEIRAGLASRHIGNKRGRIAPMGRRAYTPLDRLIEGDLI